MSLDTVREKLVRPANSERAFSVLTRKRATDCCALLRDLDGLNRRLLELPQINSHLDEDWGAQ